MRKISRLSRFLSKHHGRLSPLLILTHDYPDPDALASAYALQHLAENGFGVRARIAYGGIIGRNENKEMVRVLNLPVYKLKPSDLQKYANIALVDTQPLFQNNSFPKRKRAAIVIDQHPPITKPFADLSIVDTEAGATSVLLAQELITSQIAIPTRLATALVYGILTDTLNLYRVKQPAIIQTYLTLLPLCDIRALAKIQNPSRSRKFFSGVVRGIKKAEIRQKLIVSHLGEVENPDLVAQMADFILTCQGMQWSFCTGRYHENLHVSLRSTKPDARAGDVLRDIFYNSGQAGGHGRIAGGKIKVGGNKPESVWGGIEHLLGIRLARRLRVGAKTHFSPLYKEGHSAQRRRGKP